MTAVAAPEPCCASVSAILLGAAQMAGNTGPVAIAAPISLRLWPYGGVHVPCIAGAGSSLEKIATQAPNARVACW
jgi:hypothetical protein